MSSIDLISPKETAQSQLSPGLYIVATPIGNLRDITLRALEVLHGADRILAEDTRQSLKLLQNYKIETPLTAYHDHNVAKMLPKVMEWLDQDLVVAQISDAGTPLVSDPGYKLVRAAIDKGHKVVPLPGASASLAALVAAGLPSDRFLFAGFLANKTKARQAALSELKPVKSTLIFFESPKRVEKSLVDILAILGNRPAVLARELTKKFEEVRRGNVEELIEQCRNDPPRGEIVLVIGPPEGGEKWDEDVLDKALVDLLPDVGAKRASAELAEISGWSKRDIYQRALTLK
ncbi:MAG: 16S rRNA (cytidine(1402)-2'-O)-methyltransferase [Hellea sp.]|nr:16S rRNA (cytidine(1402)-2'-O)-methyltransferase [Hellea sp.]